VGGPDARLTPAGGVEAIRELDRVLGLARSIDHEVAPVKERARGLTAGQFLVSLASAMTAGEDHLVGLDRRRLDQAGQELEPFPTPASATAGGLARRFDTDRLRGVERAVGEVCRRWLSLLAGSRREALPRSVTLDGDATDVEVYGRRKEGAEHAYTGALTLRADIVHWAEAGVPVAWDLSGGRDDPRSSVVDLSGRALDALPDQVGEVKTRFDAGYFAADLAKFRVARGVRFAIGAKRVAPLMAAGAHAPDDRWTPAIGMDDTEVAVIDHLPKGWPEDHRIWCVARRTRIPVDRIPSSRARKRRTIPKDQLALALDGRVDAVFGYSFILTDLPVPDPDTDPDGHAEQITDVEYWRRHRTDIEALNKDAKHGAALNHLPSGDRTVNAVWLACRLIACAMSAWLQDLARIDAGNGRGRRTLARLARELIRIPVKITRGAGLITLRPPPGAPLLGLVLPRLQRLPTAK
jgi:hypothetical protein